VFLVDAVILKDILSIHNTTKNKLSVKPEKALPYLTLYTYLNPKTEYLAGNIAQRLVSLKFKNLDNSS
jgi:hypothetical protein